MSKGTFEINVTAQAFAEEACQLHVKNLIDTLIKNEL